MTMMMRTRDQLLEQRTATVNALRGHLAEFGLIAATGRKNIERLRTLAVETSDLPPLAAEMGAPRAVNITDRGLKGEIVQAARKVFEVLGAVDSTVEGTTFPRPPPRSSCFTQHPL